MKKVLKKKKSKNMSALGSQKGPGQPMGFAQVPKYNKSKMSMKPINKGM